MTEQSGLLPHAWHCLPLGIHLEGRWQKAERRFFFLTLKGILKQHHTSENSGESAGAKAIEHNVATVGPTIISHLSIAVFLP